MPQRCQNSFHKLLVMPHDNSVKNMINARARRESVMNNCYHNYLSDDNDMTGQPDHQKKCFTKNTDKFKQDIFLHLFKLTLTIFHWLGLSTKKHMIRARKKHSALAWSTCFGHHSHGWRWFRLPMFWSPQKWMEVSAGLKKNATLKKKQTLKISQVSLKKTPYFHTAKTDGNISRCLRRYPLHLWMWNWAYNVNIVCHVCYWVSILEVSLVSKIWSFSHTVRWCSNGLSEWSSGLVLSQ